MNNIIPFKSKVKAFFTGNCSRHTITHIISPIFLLTYTICVAISWILFPDFIWTEMFISTLGDPIKNPIGWIIWSIGHAVAGVLLIPMVFYIKHHIHLKRLRVQIGFLFLYLAPIGMIGLGLIPQFPGLPLALIHVINASFLLGGLYLGIWAIGPALLTAQPTSYKKLVPIFSLSYGIPLGFIIAQGIRMLAFSPESLVPFYLGFSMWEWILLYGIFIAFYLLFYMIPGDKLIKNTPQVK